MAATARVTDPGFHGRPVDVTGHVFGRITVIALIFLAAIAAWYRQPAVVTLLGLTIATVAVSRVLSRLSLRRVRCDRTLSTTSLFPGEQFTITTRLSNQKLLPLPWLELSQQAPRGLLQSNHTTESGHPVLVRSLTMPWYSRLTWREPVTPERRGYYTLPPLTLTSGDILGLYPRRMDAGSYEHVSVYPRLFPVRQLPLQRSDAAGDLTGRLSLQEDPTRMRGIREYRPGDGIRRVHWKASAHHRQLMVKLYEPSALSRINLAFVADSFDGFTDDDRFELAISAVASIAFHCVEQQMQVGFLSNARLVSATGDARLAPGSGNVQLIALLELLARVTSGTVQPFEHFASELRKLALSGAGLVIVTGTMREHHVAAFTDLAARRCPLLLLEVDGEAKRSPLPFPVRRVRGPDDLLDLGAA